VDEKGFEPSASSWSFAWRYEGVEICYLRLRTSRSVEWVGSRQGVNEGRLTIRAARFASEPTSHVGQWVNQAQQRNAPSFLFNSLASLSIPLKSLRRHPSLFSILTAQPAFLSTQCAASTVSLNPIALVTAINVDRRGLP
jgi:hypothetical protein